MHPYGLAPVPRQAEIREPCFAVNQEWGLTDASGIEGMGQVFRTHFQTGASARAGEVRLNNDPQLPEEGYGVTLEPRSIQVSASSRRGFRHALTTIRQLKNGPLYPQAKILDHPRLPVRGIHFTLENIRQMTFDDILAVIDAAARYKLNTILLEFGPRFPFARHQDFVSPSALSAGEVKRIVEAAESHDIEIIPLLQSLGHLGYMLKHERYRSFGEKEADSDQLCPTNPESFRLWTELADEFLASFPACKRFHVGGDETRELGVCDRCRPVAEQQGEGRLYASHMNRVIEWTAARGLAPIIWDDIACARPEMLDMLDPRAELMYWDYWTCTHPTPYLTARHGRPVSQCQVYDSRWDTEWRNELDDVTAAMLKGFCRGVNLPNELGQDFLGHFSKYLGQGFPKHLTAFPYLEFYQEHGRKVFCAPSCSGNTTTWHGLPDFPRYAGNIKTFAERAIAAKSAGLVTTAWYNQQREVISHGILLTGCFTW